MVYEAGYRAYAGVGSRKTPVKVLREMGDLAEELYLRGFTLRSGSADGADIAFEKGVIKGVRRVKADPETLPVPAKVPREIYLPWDGFQGRHVYDGPHIFVSKDFGPAIALVSQVHPAWRYLTQGAQKLHARNSYQILGASLDSPVEFVICWTPDGAEDIAKTSRATGGTGTAIRIASSRGIRVYNLANDLSRKALYEHLEGG